MYAISDAFKAALTTSHIMVARVDAFYAGALTLANLPISDGSVTVDRGSKTRRTLSLTIADPSYLPWNATDPLAAYGQQLVVSRGVQFANGATEVVPLGTFRINEPSGDVHTGPVTITGASMEAAIIDDKFQVPTTTRGYTGCVDAITALIRQTLPDAVITNLTAGARNPSCAVATWDADSDRWDAVCQIASAMQAEIYVDAQNRFVITDLPNVVTGTVAWNIAEGEGGTLISAARKMSRTAVCNAVVASGENAAAGSAPVSAIAKDTVSGSPTLWGGPFGKVTKSISNSLWTTSAICQSAADYALFDAIAPNIQTSLDALPNPALEGNDIIRVTAKGKPYRYLVQSLSVPLTAQGSFAITLRGGKEETP